MDYDAKKSAKVIGTGSYVPERVLTNDEIERTVPGSNAAWTWSRLGVRERRIAHADESTADLALEAARRALRDADISAREIDLIVVATTTPSSPPEVWDTFVPWGSLDSMKDFRSVP